MDKRDRDLPGVYCKIDVIVLYRRHPLVIASSLTDRELLDYCGLWGMSVEFRRAKLPEPYTFDAKGFGHIARHIGSDRRLIRSMLTKSLQKCNGKSLVRVDRHKHITVCGVVGKHNQLSFKGSKSAAKVLRQHNITKHNITKQRKGTPEKGYQCPDDLKPIQDAINAIDARNYNRVRIDLKYENMLRVAAKIFEEQYGARSGIQRCIDEIRDISLWLEGRFDIGALKRDAKHIPRTRIIKWFRNAITPEFNKKRNGDSGHNGTTGERRLSYAMSDLDRKCDEPVELGELLKQSIAKAPKKKDKNEKT